MDREQAIEVLSLLKMAYPSFYKDLSKKDAENAIKLWTVMMPERFDHIITAIQVHISTSKFPPTIADIREALTENKTGRISGEQAWDQVKRSISNFGTYREEEALKSMDEPVALLVKRFGYKDLCQSENVMADRAHFLKLWESTNKFDREQAMIPDDVKNRIAAIRQLALGSKNKEMITDDRANS